jgi:hypothetical protein
VSQTTKPIDDGGPAFPIGDQSLHPLLTGMSLRDYFAASAPMPEPADLYIALGWERDLPIGDSDDIGGEQWKDTLMTRWHELPTGKRLAIECQYRYAFADAMLAARKAVAQ